MPSCAEETPSAAIEPARPRRSRLTRFNTRDLWFIGNLRTERLLFDLTIVAGALVISGPGVFLFYLYFQDASNCTPEEREVLAEFLPKRGAPPLAPENVHGRCVVTYETPDSPNQVQAHLVRQLNLRRWDGSQKPGIYAPLTRREIPNNTTADRLLTAYRDGFIYDVYFELLERQYPRDYS